MKKSSRRIALTAAAGAMVLAALATVTVQADTRPSAVANVAETRGPASRSGIPSAFGPSSLSDLSGSRSTAAPTTAAATTPASPAAVAGQSAPVPLPPESVTPGSAGGSPAAIVLPPAANPPPAKADAAVVAPPPRVVIPPKATSGGAAPSDNYAVRGDIANAIYSQINAERAANGLGALGRSGQLNSSAHAHDVAMANTGEFSHQVTGEPTLGPRVSATGYHWTWAGENIAWASAASVGEGQALETQMYNEPPNQQNHRANILSTDARNVGVDVIVDGSGKMWLTCDFGN